MEFKELSKLNILVIGVAATGQAVLKKLLPCAGSLKAVEIKKNCQTRKLAQEYQAKGVEIFLGANYESLVSWADLIVPSPGVSPQNTLLKEAKNQKVPIVSEIEVASWLAKAPIIAITGTNGKTTTATLIKEIFSQAGYKVLLGGNIGAPFIEIADLSCDWFVVEVSSFQLAYTYSFKPKIAILLNLQADHLDWHSSFADYYQAKHKIYDNQSREDFFIYNASDKNCLPNKCQATTFGVSLAKQNDSLIVNLGTGAAVRLPISSLNLVGEHNYENILMAVTAALVAGIDKQSIMATVTSFKGLEHRLEKVATIGGVSYYNDSKATNPAAAIKAIQSFSAPLILIAGGQNKGLNFDALAQAAKGRVKLAICYGEAKADLAKSFAGANVKVFLADSFKQAVALAEAKANSGEVVLLAPACASFDLFTSYQERGNLFKTLVLSGGKNFAKTKL